MLDEYQCTICKAEIDPHAEVHPTFKALDIPLGVPELRFSPPRRWRFDWAWPIERVALEIDGGAYTYGRHNRSSGFVADMEKYSEAACHGWRIIRVTPEQFKSGAAAALVMRALAYDKGEL